MQLETIGNQEQVAILAQTICVDVPIAGLARAIESKNQAKIFF